MKHFLRAKFKNEKISDLSRNNVSNWEKSTDCDKSLKLKKKIKLRKSQFILNLSNLFFFNIFLFLGKRWTQGVHEHVWKERSTVTGMCKCEKCEEIHKTGQKVFFFIIFEYRKSSINVKTPYWAAYLYMFDDAQ